MNVEEQRIKNRSLIENIERDIETLVPQVIREVNYILVIRLNVECDRFGVYEEEEGSQEFLSERLNGEEAEKKQYSC